MILLKPLTKIKHATYTHDEKVKKVPVFQKIFIADIYLRMILLTDYLGKLSANF